MSDTNLFAQQEANKRKSAWLVAGLAKASPAELWEIEDAAERAVPKVDFGFNKPPAA